MRPATLAGFPRSPPRAQSALSRPRPLHSSTRSSRASAARSRYVPILPESKNAGAELRGQRVPLVEALLGGLGRSPAAQHLQGWWLFPGPGMPMTMLPMATKSQQISGQAPACDFLPIACAGAHRGDADGRAAAAAVLPDQPAAGLLCAHRHRPHRRPQSAGRRAGRLLQAGAPRVCGAAEGPRRSPTALPSCTPRRPITPAPGKLSCSQFPLPILQ